MSSPNKFLEKQMFWKIMLKIFEFKIEYFVPVLSLEHADILLHFARQ